MHDDAKQEILEAIGLLAEQMQDMRTDIDDRFAKLETRVVTKSYLDDKIADLRADLVVLCRKSNTKLSALVEELVAKGSLKRAAADQILAMEPFAA